SNLFTAGLEIEKITETPREVVINVRECEWARYFQERHPRVGYLMACSTDEVAYKSFNRDLRMRRTQTIMEGAEKCDFKIYAISDCHEA
ncbi:MAG: L-2-amino-thiazoline-4-carboxylic acid hydrolase, partial [Syntrophobacterales bacterium]